MNYFWQSATFKVARAPNGSGQIVVLMELVIGKLNDMDFGTESYEKWAECYESWSK